jgi:hypothetical protein
LYYPVPLQYRPDNIALELLDVRASNAIDKKLGHRHCVRREATGVIDTIIAAVRNGELDQVLGQVKRSPMPKKKAA